MYYYPGDLHFKSKLAEASLDLRRYSSTLLKVCANVPGFLRGCQLKHCSTHADLLRAHRRCRLVAAHRVLRFFAFICAYMSL